MTITASLQLRPGLPADVQAMYALDLLCFDEPFRFDLSSMRRFSSQPGAIVLLAETEGAFLGFIIVQLSGRLPNRKAYIVTLDVHPSVRRRGIAHYLISEAERSAAVAGATSIYLHVYTENVPALNFYGRLGYSRLLRNPDLYASGMDAWTYHKSLAAITSGL